MLKILLYACACVMCAYACVYARVCVRVSRVCARLQYMSRIRLAIILTLIAKYGLFVDTIRDFVDTYRHFVVFMGYYRLDNL